MRSFGVFGSHSDRPATISGLGSHRRSATISGHGSLCPFGSHYVCGSLCAGFFRRQETQDLIALTRSLADARDTLALGALLRGPLVGLSEGELLDIAEGLPGYPS